MPNNRIPGPAFPRPSPPSRDVPAGAPSSTSPSSAATNDPAIDLQKLAYIAPDVAQLGFQVNHSGYGGVDLDGNTSVLTLSELRMASTGLDERLLSPRERLALAHLRSAFHWPHVAWGPTPSTLAPLLPRAPPVTVAAHPLERAMSVSLPMGVPTAGTSTAHGGFTVEKQRADGHAVIAFPFPTDRPHQQVDEGSLSLKVYDAHGAEVACVDDVRVRHEAERATLDVTFDLARMPNAAYVRWSVDASLREAPVDASQPVPLSALASVPAEARAWLAPGPMIQRDHPAIKALASRIKSGATSVQELAQRTLDAITTLRREFGPNDVHFQNDAVAFLTTGLGECVAHANLFAALMRANDVPTRVVSGISRGNGYAINMHYQNEFLIPGAGWVHVEPQGRKAQSSRVDMVQTGVIPPALEQHGLGLEGYQGVILGTMMPVEVGPDGKDLPLASSSLRFSNGLISPDGPHANLGAALHGAT